MLCDLVSHLYERKAVGEDHRVACSAIALIKPRTIPKTTSGKLQRHEAKRAFENNELAVIQVVKSKVASYSEIFPNPKLLRAIHSILSPEEFVHVLRLFVCSVIAVEFQMDIENEKEFMATDLAEFGMTSFVVRNTSFALIT